MHNGIGSCRQQIAPHIPAWTHDLGNSGDTEKLRQSEHIDQPVLLAIPLIRSAKSEAFHPRCRTISLNWSSALLAGDPGQRCWPIAALCGHCEIVAARQPA